MERVQRAFLLAFILLLSSTAIHARELTLEQRVAAQRAIERVRFEHRIWPAVNPGAKPAFSTALPDELLRSKVEDYLSKSRALEVLWGRTITSELLQAEIDRMGRYSRDPRMLREQFDALGNDPFLIAETLGRQTLVEREIHDRYASDDRYHGELRKSVDAALASCATPACMRAMGGQYRETTWRLDGKKEGDPTALRVGAEELRDLGARLADRVGGTAESSVGRLSRVEETADAFTVVAVLSESERRLRAATVVWPKRSFDTWWAEQRSRFEPRVEPVAGELRQPLISAAPCDTDDTWKGWPPPGAPPAAASGTAVWTGAEMIVWGGGDNVNTGGRYDPATDTWTPTSIDAGAPSPRFGHTAVWTGTEMIVWGGRSQDTLLGDGGRYNPVSDTWTPTSATGGPTPRIDHTAVWTGTVMVIWGGRTSIIIAVTNTGSRYNPSTDTWSATSTSGASVPVSRYRHSAVWTGTRMVVWGGEQPGGFGLLNSGGRLDVTANTWTTTSTLNVPEGRVGHTAVWTGTEMIVWGGTKGLSPQLNSGGRYNPEFNSWTTTSTGANVPIPRDGHTAVWTGTEMIVWGGNGSGATNTGGRYDPASDAWTATSLGVNAPDARYTHTAVWTGSEMIVWGGCTGTFCSPKYSTGGRYDPSTGAWQPTASTPVFPTPRSSLTTVWTGAEMIIWGGGSPTTNSGARFDPSTDSWTATSTGANVPAARSSHSAVWTGTQMIVWGGLSGVGVTGGRYDPVTDTWTSTSTTGFVPTERFGHTAVWTGTEMIVWGGGDASDGDPLRTGARYNPASNAWVSPTRSGSTAPAARVGHTAVWTGSRMIVWGGSDIFDDELASGSRYDPQSNTWTPTSTGANVPQARAGHTAVWTGSRMIVWGGVHAPFSLNTGGQYDPVHDAWTPTAIAGAPAERDDHNVVWTGTEMIVWGGGFNLNTGGRYDPLADSWRPTSMDHVPPPGPNSAVFNGAEMIVWSPLARYCACARVYLDADGDGHGVPQIATSSCDGTVPSGYAAIPDDCDDANAGAHPGALELCNGIDDDCDLATDEGVPVPTSVPALTEGRTGFDANLSWSASADATGYDVVKGSLTTLRTSAGDFTTSTTACLGDSVVGTTAVDTEVPAVSNGLWYLVRPVSSCSGNGTYDEPSGSQQGSRDGEIAASSGACP